MRRGFSGVLMGSAALALVLGGCSEASEEAAVEYADHEASAASEYASEESMEASSDAAEIGPARGGGSELAVDLPDLPVSLPKIAYTYRYGFELPGENIATLQQKHADLCEQQGPYSCRILSMSHNGEDGEYASGELVLAVAADKARSFGGTLDDPATGLDGEQVAASIEGEDLSKALVDTEARLQARTVLRDRLLDVLRTRKGSVRELVEAERGVARVNEEIDQARAWIDEMKTRVAYSRVTISYANSTPVANDFTAPIAGAVGSLGTIFGFVIAALILLGALALPIGGLVWAGRRVNRRFAPGGTPAEA